jgi:5-hmdU DNA kinase-like protein
MFHSYEMVTDLRWTFVLGKAPDVNVWCNPGPGARRGMNRVLGRDKKAPWNGGTPELLEAMQLLLDESEKQWYEFAHEQRAQFPKIKTPMEWEMRDIEHTLCEFDKYERTRAGEGRPRGRYKGYAKNG